MKLFALAIAGQQIDLPGQIGKLNDQVGSYGLHIFQLAVDLLIFGAVFLALFFIVFGGWKWMMSGGDKKKIEDARNTLLFAAIGLIVVMLAFFVITILGFFFVGGSIITIGK